LSFCKPKQKKSRQYNKIKEFEPKNGFKFSISSLKYTCPKKTIFLFDAQQTRTYFLSGDKTVHVEDSYEKQQTNINVW
jgi:uncharacterized protein YhbP (UPF0306 family)